MTQCCCCLRGQFLDKWQRAQIDWVSLLTPKSQSSGTLSPLVSHSCQTQRPTTRQFSDEWQQAQIDWVSLTPKSETSGTLLPAMGGLSYFHTLTYSDLRRQFLGRMAAGADWSGVPIQWHTPAFYIWVAYPSFTLSWVLTYGGEWQRAQIDRMSCPSSFQNPNQWHTLAYAGWIILVNSYPG